MSRVHTASAIVRYADSLGRTGKLLGVLTLTDGKSFKVWKDEKTNDELHRQCRQLAAFPPHEVRYQFRHSEKWGDSLTMIESTLADYELADLARAADEARGRSHKQGGFIAEQISKRVQRTVDDERTHEREMGRVG